MSRDPLSLENFPEMNFPEMLGDPESVSMGVWDTLHTVTIWMSLFFVIGGPVALLFRHEATRSPEDWTAYLVFMAFGLFSLGHCAGAINLAGPGYAKARRIRKKLDQERAERAKLARDNERLARELDALKQTADGDGPGRSNGGPPGFSNN